MGFVRVGAAADPGDAGISVDDLPLGVPRNVALVTRGLDVAGNLSDGVVPTDVFPMIGTGPANFRHGDPVFVCDVVFERDPFRAKSASADRVIGIAFDVYHRRDGILRFVTQRVDDDAASDSTVWTDASSLRRSRDLEGPHLGVRFGQVEAERDRSADTRRLQKTTARKFQEAPPYRTLKATYATRGSRCQAMW